MPFPKPCIPKIFQVLGRSVSSRQIRIKCQNFRRLICTTTITNGSTNLKAVDYKSSTVNNIRDTVTLHDKIKIPRFGLGVYDVDVTQTRQAVLWALECGYRQFDTAARYKNERSVGEAVRESRLNRDEVFIVTKVYHEHHGYHKTLKAFEKSLTLLGLDYVDLYLIHFPVPGNVVGSWKAMAELKEKGLIRSIGVSNFNIHHLEALKMHSDITPSVNQIEVHPYLQEQPLVNYCRDRGITIQAYSPLTKGKKIEEPTLKWLAKKYNKTTAQILLRWSLQKGFVCIPKSFNRDRIKENANIFDFVIEKTDTELLDSLEEGFRTGRDKILWPWNG